MLDNTRDYALDHLYSYDVEPADPQHLIPNPQFEELETKLKSLRQQLTKLQKAYATDLTGSSSKPLTAAARSKLEAQIHELEEQIQQQRQDKASVDKAVPVSQVVPKQEIIKLETQRKGFVDLIKLTCYRAENAILEALNLPPSFSDRERRMFLKAVFRTAADLMPDQNSRTLLVRFHSMSQPRYNKVLAQLCDIATQKNICYPGTDMKLVF